MNSSCDELSLKWASKSIKWVACDYMYIIVITTTTWPKDKLRVGYKQKTQL